MVAPIDRAHEERTSFFKKKEAKKLLRWVGASPVSLIASGGGD
jgi:hypothetical protein